MVHTSIAMAMELAAWHIEADDQYYNLGCGHHPVRPIFRMHPNSGLGSWRPHLVRRRSPRPLGGDCCSGNERHLQY